jgi:hypothetical protein
MLSGARFNFLITRLTSTIFGMNFMSFEALYGFEVEAILEQVTEGPKL